MSLLFGDQVEVCLPASVQMGDGPSPAPAPAGPTSSMVPNTASHSTMTEVPMIQVAWTLVLP
jgi:hypothetical protein